MRKTKTVYSFDDNGVFAGIDIAWETWDLNGVFLLPANSTEVAPIAIPEGYFAKWNGSKWEFESIPVLEPEPEPELEPELPLTWDQIRLERTRLLNESDWTDLPNSPVKNKGAWIAYRRALRDLPITFGTPEEVVWPEKP